MRRTWLGLLLLTGCSFDDGGTPSSPDAILVTPPDAEGACDVNDEDDDGVGNACDNCPHVANPDQEDGEADGAGDACDPQPDTAGNELLYFEGFDSAAALDDWRVFNGGTWQVRDGALYQLDPSGLHTLYLGTEQFADVHVVASVTIDDISTASDGGLGMLLSFAPGGNEGGGYYCLTYDNLSPTEPARLHLITFRGLATYQDEGVMALGSTLAEGMRIQIAESHQAAGALTCGVSSSQLSGSLEGSDNQYSSGFVAMKTQWMAAHVDYVAVFAMP